MAQRNAGKKVYLLLFLIILFLAIVAFIFVTAEMQDKPVLKAKVGGGDVEYLYKFYVSNYPHIEDRPYYGNGGSAVTIVIYSDIMCEACREFVEERFQEIKDTYIHTGIARFYHKSHLTADDILERNDKFIYANSLSCFNSIAPEKYWEFYNDMHSASVEELSSIAESHGAEKTAFEDCVNNQVAEEVIEDSSETENFGLDGVTPVFYIGLQGTDNEIFMGTPTENQFRRAIREKQVIYGD